MALLVAEGIDKAYPGVQALAGVDFDVDAGETHALLGENGAGKSTLMKVIAGSVAPDAGRLRLGGESLRPGDPMAARKAGIGIVYQDLSLVPALSIAENVLLGRLPRTRLGLVDWPEVRRQAEPHLERLGLRVEPNTLIRTLGISERQLVEIAKVLSEHVRVLLLDEPTSALSDREARRLFEVIDDLTNDGVAVVYVSHRLAEVLEIADRITVLRDGVRVDTVKAGETDESGLATMMVGRSVQASLGRGTPRAHTEDGVVLRAKGLAHLPWLKPIDLELRRGEIVTVFGLVGSGRSRLCRTLFGLEPPTEGRLEIAGEPVTLTGPADAIAKGLGYVGEDRAAGLVPRMGTGANITLASLPKLRKGIVMDFEQDRELAQRFVDFLAIRTPSLTRPVANLSGGNQQKVLLSRWLAADSKVLILDDPTRGIDVGATEEVYRLVRELGEQGVAVLYLTSEIKEARSLGDRVLVMADGRIVAEFGPEASEDQIMQAAGGVHG
jgi:ribose transport system ATP-binding protein